MFWWNTTILGNTDVSVGRAGHNTLPKGVSPAFPRAVNWRLVPGACQLFKDIRRTRRPLGIAQGLETGDIYLIKVRQPLQMLAEESGGEGKVTREDGRWMLTKCIAEVY